MTLDCMVCRGRGQSRVISFLLAVCSASSLNWHIKDDYIVHMNLKIYHADERRARSVSFVSEVRPLTRADIYGTIKSIFETNRPAEEKREALCWMHICKNDFVRLVGPPSPGSSKT